MSLHRITDSSEAFWSREDRWAVSNVQTYAPRKAAVTPWKALGFLSLAILCGIALILIPAAIEAARHPIPAF